VAVVDDPCGRNGTPGRAFGWAWRIRSRRERWALGLAGERALIDSLVGMFAARPPITKIETCHGRQVLLGKGVPVSIVIGQQGPASNPIVKALRTSVASRSEQSPRSRVRGGVA
jgi:hypothetical protein